jgi:hypothetical protein
MRWVVVIFFSGLLTDEGLPVKDGSLYQLFVGPIKLSLQQAAGYHVNSALLRL